MVPRQMAEFWLVVWLDLDVAKRMNLPSSCQVAFQAHLRFHPVAFPDYWKKLPSDFMLERDGGTTTLAMSSGALENDILGSLCPSWV